MAESKKASSSASEADELRSSSTTPLIFISHDSHDAEFAEAFSKLLKSVSAGMLKSFRSSDKKGTEGIEFGDEWYKRLMSKLESASDVVCLLTEQSLNRPWILYEAGVAKGKLDTPVHGIALGIPLERVSSGPFYQFQNCDDSEESLTKLVMQLARRIPDLEPDSGVVNTQVKAFKAQLAKVLAKLSGPVKQKDKTPINNTSVAKLFEEAKVMFRDLPSRVADRITDRIDPIRRGRIRRFHPMMFEEIMHMFGKSSDPIVILMAASLVRDDLPWLYEIAVEAYRAAKSGDQKAVEQAFMTLRHVMKFTMNGPFMEELSMSSKEAHMMISEFPRMMEHMIQRYLEQIEKPTSRRKK